MASNVPKFTSFRPKPKPAVEPPKEASKSEVRAKSSSRPKKHGAQVESRVADTPKSEQTEPSSKLYFSDRRGDPDILKYGALSRYDIPTYRRAGYGYVLGLSLDQKIDRERSSHSKTYMTYVSGRQQERLMTAKNVPKESSRTLRIVQSSESPSLAEELDFIALSNHDKRRRDDSDSREDGGPPDLDYRGIERDVSQPLDPDTQYDDHLEDLTAISELTKKNTELVRKTREHPEDIQPWLDFIEHQEVMIAPERSLGEVDEARQRQLADVRIPIYEEALKKVKNAQNDHIQLYRGLLKEAQKSWTESKLWNRWTEVLKVHTESPELWLMYLDFVQSHLARFKYEACRKTFLECLDALQGSKEVAVESVLHIFVRMTSMIHGAGYQELALAIWQSVLERNLSQPPMTAADLGDFEQFWESEAPRIGEAEASGWRKAADDDIPSNTESLLPQNPGDSIFEDFRKREHDSIEKLRYPGRASDEVGEDDAFHTIFYADIEPYIKSVPADTPTVLLLEAFLCFCGLPSLPRIGNHQRLWWDDPFIAQRGADTPSSHHLEGAEQGSIVDKFEQFFACEKTSFQMTSELLFHDDFNLSGVRIGADFIQRILQLAAMETKDAILGEYLLAFEYRHSPTEVVKTAKQLLKAQPTSQHLYHAYGLVESRRGKPEKANQVFSMALSMRTLGTSESLQLFNSWVWEALYANDHLEALWRLSSPSGKLPTRSDPTKPPNAALIQNASTTLSSISEQSLLTHAYPSAVLSTSLLALVTYLTSSLSPEIIISAHHNLLSWFTSHALHTSPASELSAQSLARFLLHHATHAPILKPSLIRTALEPYIALFPNNTILLSLYAANESRFAVDDRVRGIMAERALPTSVAGWCFAIRFEEKRAEVARTAGAIRAAYKRATHAEASGAHSLAIWTSYLRFEVEQLGVLKDRVAGERPGKDGRKRTWEKRVDEARERVKETFYAGLRNLPWCKEFIMLGFGESGKGVFGEGELWKIYRVLQEKELRVYVELD
ncbi:hypothetical protein HBH49_114720 [Parastagonospora nodorum]|nr:hypothetical protein HBH49_114720 [Parastagonospora nodorum]